MYRYLKRLFDIVFSLIALIILLPIFIPVVIVLLLTGEHTVFYCQPRVGYKNKHFGIWKFSTMLKDSPNMGTKDLTMRNDPRVTKVGKFLRRSKINELPQMMNILTGDMSFVGPRPLMPTGFDRYSDEMKAKVYNVKPGLTGIGSIVFRDEELVITKSALSPEDCYRQVILPRKGALELWYQQHYNFYTDFMLLFLTAWYIFFPSSNLVYKVFPSLPRDSMQVAPQLKKVLQDV
jgi:lipopolysaccharide/colanic/teichoic acid biosynthesis glycosyltransferase